jgi:signal transduction histidine kinase
VSQRTDARDAWAHGVRDRQGEVTDDFVVVSVCDTGTGMSADVLTHVFEPFFTTKEIGKGSGLGLPQVYGFTQQSGGTITVASVVGEGTTVTMLLPRTAGSPAEPAPRAPRAPWGHWPTGAKSISSCPTS